MTLPAGTRVRMQGSPWPEREGCEGVVVAPRADGIYPQPAPVESLVKLDDDPLDRMAFSPGANYERSYGWWSCVVSDNNLETL